MEIYIVNVVASVSIDQHLDARAKGEGFRVNHERHREITKLVFGYEYVLVHSWLDGTYGKWVNTKHSQFNHWLERHHVDAIDKQYSDDTKRGVAYLHVVSDIADRCRYWFLPQNEDELRNYLLARGIKLFSHRG